MKRIFLFLNILLCTLTMSAQSAWQFNRGDSISWQPTQDMTITFEKDPAGFFWQNIQTGTLDIVRMPIETGDGITFADTPFLQVEKKNIEVTNDGEHRFEVRLKTNNENWNEIHCRSNNRWLRLIDINGSQFPVITYTFEYDINNKSYDRNGKVVFYDDFFHLRDTIYVSQPVDNNIPPMKADKEVYEICNNDSNIFHIQLDVYKANEYYLRCKVIGDKSDNVWIKNVWGVNQKDFTFQYVPNYSDEDYEVKIVFYSATEEVTDTVKVVCKGEESMETQKGLLIRLKNGKYVGLPLDSKIAFSYIDDENIVFSSQSIGNVRMTTSKIDYFRVSEVKTSDMMNFTEGDTQTGTSGASYGDDGRKLFVNTELMMFSMEETMPFLNGGALDFGKRLIRKDGYNSFSIGLNNEKLYYQIEDISGNTYSYGNSTYGAFYFDSQKYYDVPENDRKILMDLFHSTGGDKWYRNDGWGSDLPVIKWYGIRCDYLPDYESVVETKVDQILLTDNNLTGTLPESLKDLSGLKSGFVRLLVDNNKLEGAFPEHPLSEFMDNAVYAGGLDFSQNNFNSDIPEWAMNHPKFKVFWPNFCFQNGNDASIFDNVTIPAPDINITDLNGNRHISPEEYTNNKLTIFYYTATWCPFSPGLNAKLIPAYKYYKDYGLNIIGLVNFDGEPHDTEEGLAEYCKEKGITWPNVSVSDNYINPFDDCNGNAVPRVFAVNEKGELVFQSFLYTSNYNDLIPLIEDIFGPIHDKEYYASTDYSKDGEVIKLQAASEENGIDLVLMGEAFIDKDMETDGKYERKINEAMEKFFSVEPYISLRSRFNVYMVKAVSPNEEFACDARHAFNESNEKVFEYAKKALGENAKRMMVGVVYNTDYPIDRSYTVMYERDNSFVAYMMDGVSNVLNHEMGGHGIAFLLDEYVEPGMEDQSPSEEEKNALDAAFANYGEGANVDWRSNPSEVKWAHFLNDSRYNDEGLGVYEGAWLYGHGAYRPSENSMMRHNDCGFNAPSREAIYKRVMKLSEGDDWTYDYETFVAFDAPVRAAYSRQKNAPKKTQTKTAPTRRIESRPPTIYKGTWRDAGKCEKVEYSVNQNKQ